MKSIKLTKQYLEQFFYDNSIEDDNLFECLEGREGIIEESTEQFSNDKNTNHMVLSIKLKMTDM